MRFEAVVVSYGREKVLLENHAALRALYPELPVCWGIQGPLSGEISAAVESDPHLRLEHREQPHITAALNQCIRSSEVDVVIMLDDDARPCPGWLEAFEAAFAVYPDAAYIMGREIRTRCHGLGGLLARGLLEAACRPFAPAEALSAGRLVGWINSAGLLLGNFDLPGVCLINAPRGCNLALRRAAWERLGGFSEDFTGNQWGFEVDFGLRARHAGLKGIFWGAAMAVHDQESGGGTRAVRSWGSLRHAVHNHVQVNRHLGWCGWIGALPRLARAAWKGR